MNNLMTPENMERYGNAQTRAEGSESELHDLLSAEDYMRQRDMLAEALGRILIAHEVINPMPLTGPMLLMVAEGYADHLEGR